MKKMITLALTALLIFACLAFPAGAANEGIMLTGALCMDCGNGEMVHQPREYTSWRNVDVIPCVHGNPHITDDVQERYVVDTYTCNSCGRSDVSLTVERQVVHR